MLTVSINQPAYLPWLGYFHRIAASDLHIVLDHVQFEKNSFTNRNRARTNDGPSWLTIPIATSGKFGDLAINKLRFADGQSWRRKHWNTLRMCYGKAPHFAEYAPAYERLYSQEWPDFITMARSFLTQHLLDLNITTRLLFSSEMGIGGAKSELVLNLCRAVGATTYLSGALGRDYLDADSFSAHQINVRFQDYVHPTYQQTGTGFIPNLCILDLLFNQGVKSKAVLLKEPQ